MSRRGFRCNKHTILFDAPAASNHHPFTLTVASSGTATIVKNGLQLHAAASSASAGAFINSTPWELTRLKSLEYVFRLADLEATAIMILGVGSSFSASQDTVPFSVWAKIANATLTLESDDGTDDVSADPGITVSASTWYRLRMNFWEQNLAKSPPAVSEGYLVSMFLEDSRGFSKRLQVQSTLNMYDVRNVDLSPYMLCKLTSTMTGTGPKLIINQINYELAEMH